MKVFTDGASRGNPGLSGAGILVSDSEGKTLCEASEFLGVMTNNAAEYTALLKSLNILRLMKSEGMHADHVEFYSDSLLLVNQLSGKYKIKNQQIGELVSDFKNEVKQLKIEYTIKHISRKENKRADKLANLAIDKREEQQVLEF